MGGAVFPPCYLPGASFVLEKALAPHSSTLARKIPWTEEPGWLQSMGSQRVEHDWATSLHFSLSWIGEGNGNPLQCSCLENPRDGGAWWAAVYGVKQSRTRLKWLSSSSSIKIKKAVLHVWYFLWHWNCHTRWFPLANDSNLSLFPTELTPLCLLGFSLLKNLSILLPDK